MSCGSSSVGRSRRELRRLNREALDEALVREVQCYINDNPDATAGQVAREFRLTLPQVFAITSRMPA